MAIELTKEQEEGREELAKLYQPLPCGYIFFWTLFCPFAVCAGYLLSPRNKWTASKAENIQPDLENQTESSHPPTNLGQPSVNDRGDLDAHTDGDERVDGKKTSESGRL